MVWILVFFLVLLRVLSPITADLSYFFLAVYALGGRRQIIVALFLSWFFTMMNPGLAAPAALGGLSRYVVLSSAAMSAIFHSGLFGGRIVLRGATFGTILIGLGIIAHSILVSPNIDVSILKASIWLITIATLFSVWGGMNQSEWSESTRFVFGGLIVVALASIPLVGTSVGVLRNGWGFQGLLNHPQVFGPAMGVLGTWAFAKFLEQQKLRADLLLLTGLCVVFVFMSASRTAGVSMVFGIAGAVAALFLLTSRSLPSILPGLSNRHVWIVVLGLAFVAVLNIDKVGAGVASFITKSEGSETHSLVDAYETSRGFLLYRMVENILASPFHGIGFGSPSIQGSMEIERDPIFGLPFGAPIEKGVVPIMVIEELGIPFAVLIFYWIFTLIRRTASAEYSRLAVLITVLLLNMGEAVFFSPGGQGLLVLILVAWSAASPCKVRTLNA